MLSKEYYVEKLLKIFVYFDIKPFDTYFSIFVNVEPLYNHFTRFDSYVNNLKKLKKYLSIYSLIFINTQI